MSITPTTVNVAEGSNTALTVSLPTGVTTANALLVNYTIGGTATSDTDYTALTGSVTIPAGQGSATINVSSSSDSIIESSETVTVTGATTAGFTWSPSASSSTVTITDVTSVASRVLSINPTSVSTDEGTSTDLTVSLPTGVTTAAALIVNYTIAGTATSATDYTALTGSVTIPAGSGSATITIAALSDSAIESDETLVVTGATTAGFTWSPTNNISTVTITNVDDPASKVLSFSPITISTAEGSSSLITVSLPTGITTATAVVVNYTVSGTATSGSDYTALSGTVTIGAGQNSGTINVSALTDGVIESDETVILTEGVTPGFTWNASANSATVTLTDATGNNPANKVLSILPTTTNVVEGTSTNLTVSLPTGITVSSLLLVNYTVSGTATGTTDYAALSGTVTIAAGQNSATLNVSGLTDNILESNETVVLTGATTNGYTWGINNVSTVTINDATGNNPANKVLTITPDTVNVDEGMATTLTVSLPNSIITANPLIVNYTVSGTATSGTDFTALTGSVTIPAGSSSATINVAALTDSAIESDETIVVTGAITSGFTWNPSVNTSTVTIKNVDDPANKVLSFSPITTSVLEGGLSTITVSLPTGVSTAVALAVNYTISGTALSASDYRLLNGTVTIGAGQNSATISISTLADGVIETDETVILTGGTTPSFTWNVAANTAIVTITDATGNNPANKVLSIIPTTATVAEGATTNLTVSLPTGITTAQDLNVNYTLSGTAGISDFRPLTGTVIIPAGSGSFTIPVEALNDGAIESPETIVFTGAETSSFTWGVRNVATVTITDETGNNPANKVLSILPATMNVSEGNSTSLIISLPNGITTDNSLIVNYAIGGTASKDSDFGSLTGKVTIPAGANSVNLDVTTLNDLVLESDETIVVTGAATNGFTWGSNNVSTITITDETGNNPANKVLSILPEISSISEGSSTNLVISLPSGITTGVAQVVNYNIGGTTDDGVDYSTLTGTATIPAGSNSVTIPVRALTDRVLESDETVELEGAATTGFT
ncbi:beta strand repeat-containing protein [Flavobacterium geliluteum]|uniref:Calx-beta domain-containing protein n=1 Tax=Flavobacterium geliluteum TaxID=2816120 RepID=A0A941AV68_9FLAO|nr:Calx-beta domain-containing protein [Flavobacterium geliluteum]MBP4136914.1 hypothetical protein [Flavobacterium geliluteum]